jgi:phospholipase C
MCGFTNHRDTGILLPDQPIVYDWLLDRGVKWRVYAAGLPFFALMPRLSTLLLTSHFRRLEELPKDLVNERPDDRPQVIFIEPDYSDCPVHFQSPCDNHPPLAMAPGEVFLAQVYKWLSSDAKQWARTVFIVTYDEHGGFFDHVPPLEVKYRNPNGVAFDTTGPRVPVLS